MNTAHVRKLVTYVEAVTLEGGQSIDPPLLMIGVAAVLRNPWAGQGFVQDLKPKILECAKSLGTLLSNRMIEIAGSGDRIEAYGKAALVGTSCEIEHGRALIHQLRFGNLYRDAVGAKSYLNFANTRGPAGASIQIPMFHKHEDSKRSHFLTVQFTIPDAPSHDELVIALGAATGPSPNHRIGDRFVDIAEMKQEADADNAQKGRSK